jgi:hypothetical protein
MQNRHWVIVYNEFTDECRFMRLLEEWLPFKYLVTTDIQPAWEQLGVYETQEDAFMAFLQYETLDRTKY